jgi:Asp-tRNA(Asn)/Glu-tRNA(Gln) amidotransferase C subunit
MPIAKLARMSAWSEQDRARGAAAAAAAIPIERASSPFDEWLLRMVSAVIRWHNEGPPRATIARAEGVTEAATGHAIIRRAALFSALGGGATGMVATGATLLAAETQGMGAIVTAPVAALSIAAETVLRLLTHVKMACELGDLFEVRFDADSPADVWALFSLSFGREQSTAEEDDPAARLLRMARVDFTDTARGLATRLLGEGLARNVVPFVGVISSSVTNWTVTNRLGDTVRRFVRYRRAFDGVMRDERLKPCFDRLVEGIWFVFVADGRLRTEETALLSALLRRTTSAGQEGLSERLDDLIGWFERLDEVPKTARRPFFHALEIAAVVDKTVSLRERKILQHVAQAFGLPYDEKRLARMTRELSKLGMLLEQVSSEKAAHLRAA